MASSLWMYGAGISLAVLIGVGIGWWGAGQVTPRKAVTGAPPVATPKAMTPAPIQPVQRPPLPETVPEEPQVSMLPPPQVTPEDHPPSWRSNAIAFTPEPGKPMIAIVIDDMGVDVRRSALVTALPPPLTTSFLTYAQKLPAQTAAARAAGHELMLHMPMEPGGTGYDPGPDVLLTSMSPQVLRDHLRQSLMAFSGYVGINNHMGSKLTADPAAMKVVMAELRAKELLFLDSLTSSKSVAAAMAKAEGVPNLTRNVFLDDDPQPSEIRRQLRRVEDKARQSGAAIAIGHPRDTTIMALRDWIPEVKAAGFQFVPISALAKAKYGP